MELRHRRASSLIVILLLTLFTCKQAVAFGIYFSGSINGVIVDKNTRKPLEGVVVTASWILLPHFVDTTRPVRTLEVAETVTDHMGHYELPGFRAKFSLWGYLRDDQPLIRFFMDGYEPLVVANNSVYHPGFKGDKDHLIKREINLKDGSTAVKTYEPEEHMVRLGKKPGNFMLIPFTGSDRDYVSLLVNEYHGAHNYIHSLDYLREGNNCEWKSLPATFSQLHNLKKRLDAKGVQTYELPYVSYLKNQPRCGDSEELFSDYLN
ncbi:MAG TPA: hypothetical protein VM011_04675 [Gammaproteobacteria bacterium]|nr:hypothetical protein [Gammaproteobacteria bacterium]